ncbi:Poly(ethylene terephthalate) hydrolase [Tumidithrix helvetica PCC 7403]|uniref:alpha/beta hydrolase family protein n=1 Tax=Tumidithrix helvetica TaxID=3457545 RepID=UPI003C8D9C9C
MSVKRMLWLILLAILTAIAVSRFTDIKGATLSPLLAQTSSSLRLENMTPSAQALLTAMPKSETKPETKLASKLEPRFDRVGNYATTIPANGDLADVYYPIATPSQPTQAIAANPKPTFPIALLLQGFNVEKSVYSKFATQIARHGFVVVLPNHYTSVRGQRELFAQVGEVPDVLAYARAENQNPKSPLAGAIDVTKLVLIGHSHGGFIGMDAIRNVCDPPWCVGTYTRPPELLAGVFYGSDLWYDGNFISIKNDRIPIAFIVGSKDSLIADSAVKSTYDIVQTPPKAFVRVLGANHYGIADRDNPSGSPKEKARPAIAQEAAIDTISRWTAAFLRAYATNDGVAMDYLKSGARSDRGVNVLWQG